MLRFFTILPKKFSKVSPVSFSVLTVSPFSLKLILSLAMNFSGSEGFTVFQKSLLSETFFHLKVFRNFSSNQSEKYPENNEMSKKEIDNSHSEGDFNELEKQPTANVCSAK